ncbi:MAG: hypothetical protein JWN91_2258 [Nocardioides sp.]|nr:hypothetical protein [Nocardioides sp.]
MAEYDDPEVERLVRASLDTHAGEVDTTVPAAARARAAARPHRGRWMAAGAAVAVAGAISAVTVPVLVVDHQEPTDDVQPLTGLPTQWRTEYWHDISVEVPADWGWGVTPTRVGDQLVRCGDGSGAYVGRPIATSDLCAEATGAGPYVWFDSPLEPGVDGDQETVEVDGERVTVATDGAALRERILSSVKEQHLCPAATGERGPGLGGTPIDGLGDVQSFEMCAYALAEDGTYQLVYGAELGERDYLRWSRAINDPPQSDLDCSSAQELVVLKGSFDDTFGTEPLALTWVVDLPCGQVRSAYGDFGLTDEMEAAWAGEGARKTLSYFIGPLG